MPENGASWQTPCGLGLTRIGVPANYEEGTTAWVRRLDSERGAMFCSSFEYPGRYTRWDIALVNPPIVIESQGRNIHIKALNARGVIIIAALGPALRHQDFIASAEEQADQLSYVICTSDEEFSEEDRSRQPSVFSLIRAVSHALAGEDPHFGAYGAFGYDLVFQFEAIPQKLVRAQDQRDLVLYIPDEILIIDHYGKTAECVRYEFSYDGQSSAELPRSGETRPFVPANFDKGRGDHAPGEYAKLVAEVKEWFNRGDLFEAVPGQVFYQSSAAKPSAVSNQLRRINPSPYGFFINLGAGEYLVGSSPEMYVRVTNRRRVETCPISGTVRRGNSAIEDEKQIRSLLNSEKDTAELTMCTDVDRNDKSRICEAGSVRVIGRRQIEMYSHLIHTVDHVEGILREDRDAMDAFLSHAWAVTVTGAPKRKAIEFIENRERSPRRWYGGAVGGFTFDGNVNTGLTLRTIRIKDGFAEIRAGATLLADSDPEQEEAETELKAEAMRQAILNANIDEKPLAKKAPARVLPGNNRRILLIDHQDSFVHTLAGYFRQTGAETITYRPPIDEELIARIQPDLAVLSPGPGRPSDFDCQSTIKLLKGRQIPIFGVCLGLQALVESEGGALRQLNCPMHGKSSKVKIDNSSCLFKGIEGPITVGRYHSLYADRASIPSTYSVTAETVELGVIMAVEHKSLPVAAVQFHPESIMSMNNNSGYRIIENVITHLTAERKQPA